MSEQTIPWGLVDRAWVANVRGRKFIPLRLKDTAHVDWKGRFRVFRLLNSSMGFGDVSLTAQGLNCSFNELKAAVENHLRVE